MNSVIYVLLLLIFILGIGQAIYLTKRFKSIEGQIKGFKNALEVLDKDTWENYMSIGKLNGKAEEINQRIKEGFEINLNHLLQLRQSNFDIDLIVNENKKSLEETLAVIKQESAKNLMLHVRGVSKN